MGLATNGAPAERRVCVVRTPQTGVDSPQHLAKFAMQNFRLTHLFVPQPIEITQSVRVAQRLYIGGCDAPATH